MKIKNHLNLTIAMFVLGMATACLAVLANAEDYVLDGKTAELEPGKTFDNMTLTNGAVLTTYGVLHIKGKLLLNGNSKIVVKTFDKSIPGTGTLIIYADDIRVAEGSTISADGAGNDGRGATESGGGGYGGIGGGGTSGNRGASYGSESGREISMGSKSSEYMGGGAISLICDWLYIDGTSTVTSNGAGGSKSGGGSGGGILIDSTAVYIQGGITANGGDGDGTHGGGGGRIKIHYYTKEITGAIVARGGSGSKVGGYPYGKNGTVY